MVFQLSMKQLSLRSLAGCIKLYYKYSVIFSVKYNQISLSLCLKYPLNKSGSRSTIEDRMASDNYTPQLKHENSFTL